MKQLVSRGAVAACAALLIAGLTVSGGTTPVRAHAADGHPARIQDGSCDALGPVTDKLVGVGATITPEGTPVPAVEMVGAEDAIPIDVSQTTLETKLSDLVDAPHAIVVYESDEAMDHVIVCGNVGGAMMMQMPGMPMPGDELVVWLAPQEDATAIGEALLRSEVKSKTTVTLIIGEGMSGEGATSGDHAHETMPEASPVAG